MDKIAVTPFVGVWIEIAIECVDVVLKEVTPFVGVWIEIAGGFRGRASGRVTPFVGVWIEIRNWSVLHRNRRRHSLRGSVD